MLEILPDSKSTEAVKYSKSSAADAHFTPMTLSGLLPFLFSPLNKFNLQWQFIGLQDHRKMNTNILTLPLAGQYISTSKLLCNCTLIPSDWTEGPGRKDWSPLMMKPWHYSFIFHNTVLLRTPLLLWKFP